MPSLTGLMKMDRAYILKTFHPAVVCAYFMVVIVLSICISAPEFVVASLLLAAISDLMLNGSKALRLLLSLVALIALMSVLSPLFNPLGATVLFSYFGDRPYTLEAILYGASVASMFAAMILWFHVASSAIDPQGLSYLLSKTLPKLGIVIGSAMMLLPRLWRRLRDLEHVDPSRCSDEKGSIRLRISSALGRILNLFRWSFDEGMDRAASMRSRGFGSGPATSYSKHAFSIKDALLIVVVIALASITIAFAASSHLSIVYFPEVTRSALGIDAAISICAFVALLAVPSILTVWGWAHWRSCVSTV